MAYFAFAPELGGMTALVGTTPVQTPANSNTQNQVQNTAYRIRCLVAGYIAWSPQIVGNATPTNFSAATPAAGASSLNTIGMSVGQVEIFSLPNNAWFVSSVAAGFEVTGGEGV